MPNVVWDFQGVFRSRELAEAACRNTHYFTAPIELDQELPDETIELPGSKYFGEDE